jgi:RHS repeat-associated protein
LGRTTWAVLIIFLCSILLLAAGNNDAFAEGFWWEIDRNPDGCGPQWPWRSCEKISGYYKYKEWFYSCYADCNDFGSVCKARGYPTCVITYEWRDPAVPDTGPPPSPPDSRTCSGDPVDLFNGNYYYSEDDIGYPYPSKVQIARLYSSGNIEYGPFGKGTSTSYGHRLIWSRNPNQGEQYLIYIPPEGGRYFFPETGGKLISKVFPFLSQAVTRVNADGTRELAFKGGDTYRFTSSGWLIRKEDRNGNWVDITRDASGNIETVTDNFGRSLDITPTTINGVTVISSIKDALQREVVYGYDAEPKLTSVTYPDKKKIVYTYQNGIMNSVTRYEDHTDPNDPGITEVVHTYDPSSRVVNQVYADNSELSIDYILHGSGYVANATVTNPRNDSTSYKFNSEGYLVETIDPNLQSTVKEHDYVTNRLTSVTDRLSRTTAYTYQGGLVNSVTDPAGNETYYEYGDPNVPKPTLVRDALGNETQMAYDANGNITDMWLPGESVPVHMTYNRGLLTSVTSAIGNTTTFDYYSTGQIANALDPLGNQTHYEYDAVGRLASVTDPRQKVTSYIYNTPAREVEITDPLGGTTTVKYDSEGNMVRLTDARGNTVSYTYDARGRAESMTDQVLAAESYTHDVGDNLTSVTDRKNQVTDYSDYDNLDRLTRVDYQDGSYTTIAYDPVGRIVNTVDSLSGMIQYTYTDTSLGEFPDKVKQVVSPEGTVSYSYDNLGRRESMDVNGELAVTYQYLPNGLVNAISATNPVTGAPMVFTFSYDDAGKRTGISYPNGVTASYTYDQAGRPLSVAHKDSSGQALESLSYSYDANGNRTGMERMGVDSLLPGLSNSPDYNPANRLDAFNGEALSHDANGNMTGWGDKVFTWDVRDRLVGIANTPAGDASFSYDALGRRVQKTVGGVTTKYLYDGLDIVKETDGLGNTMAWYVRSLNIDEPLARIAADGTVRYYHADALGSIIALTDANGVVRTRYNYSPYGVTQVIGEASENPFQFTAREKDETGSYYYRARYYSPEMGRFISEDPIGLAGGSNFYSYVRNAPVNWLDPLGLWRKDVHYDLTYELALIAGFSESEAHLIAQADQGLDDSIFTSPWNPFGGTQLHFMSPETAQVACAQAVNREDLGYLGQTLHMLQDTYAHYRQGYRWYTLGHIRDGHNPDISYMNANYIRMKEETLKYLREYRERHY